jgi:signal transduction histidine kinase/ligand-binding sensor domain-containing protein
VVKLFEDSRTNLWIATDNAGVFVSDPQGSLRRQDLGNPSVEGPAVTLCEDASGFVWFRMSGGQIYCARDGRAGRLCNSAEREAQAGLFVDYSRSRPGINSFALMTDNSGLIWIATPNHLNAWRMSTNSDTRLSPVFQRLETNVVRFEYLLPARNGGFWLFAQFVMDDPSDGKPKKVGLVQRRTAEGEPGYYFPYPWAEELPILSAVEDAQGNPVVGTYGDYVWWFDPNGHARRVNALSHGFVFSITFDREGNLWVGTDGKGLNRVKRPAFQVLEPSHLLAVKSVCEDARGGIWYGVNNGGVHYWRDGELQDFLPNYSARAVLVDVHSNVWIGTESAGLITARSNNFTSFSVTPSLASINALYQDREGRLWVGAVEGLGCWNGAEWRVTAPREWRAGSSVQAIVEDRQGALWIGTSRGLTRWSQGASTAFSKTNGLPGENVQSLYADADNVLWAGTSGGLGRFSGGMWTTFSKEQGLVNNAVSYVIEDPKGFLWLGSKAGLMRIEKKALNDYATHPTNSILVRAYDEEEGLPSGECTFDSEPAACLSHDGKLWFATIAGLAWVDPGLLFRNTNAPPVRIEAVRVDGRLQNSEALRAPLPAQITIPYGRESLEIDFTMLNLSSPAKGRFAFKLEGYESAWTEKPGEVRSVRYSNLPHGQYTFRVKACNEDWVWNDHGVSLAIEVLPPFWRTWWFIGGMSVLTLAMIVVIVHLVSTQRLQRQVERLRHQEALEKERARIARDLHDQLGANLTQVALLGEMAEADKDSPEEIESHARQISQTARETTHALDEIVWTINPSNDTVDGLINYVCKYAQEYFALAGLRYRLEVPSQLPNTPVSPELRHNLFLAAKESINNIVKHARADSTWVRLTLQPDKFVLEIEDNGRGLSPGDREKGRSGLKNLEKRMQDIGGKFEIAPREGGGTIVRLTAPIQSAAPA